jgi:hypothetical protein
MSFSSDPAVVAIVHKHLNALQAELFGSVMTRMDAVNMPGPSAPCAVVGPALLWRAPRRLTRRAVRR